MWVWGLQQSAQTGNEKEQMHMRGENVEEENQREGGSGKGVRRSRDNRITGEDRDACERATRKHRTDEAGSM